MASSVLPSLPAGGNGVVTSELATIGQYTSQLGELTNAVDCGILCLTIIGAGGMIASMINKRYGSQKGTTVRSWLVLFLVFGDLCLGIVGLIPTVATLAGRPPRAGSAFCNSMGFLLAASVWAQHINTLMLCIATHFILIMPLSYATRLVEQYWYLSLPGVWATSFVLAGIGWAVQGSWGYNNGLCYYQPGLFSEIYQFVPRGIVFSIISILYIRLFVFLRRPDLIRSSNPTSDPASLGSIQSRKWSLPLRWTRASGASESTAATLRPGFWHRPSAASIMAEGAVRSPKDVTGLDAYDIGGSRDENVARLPATTATTQDNIPQWERLELPVFVGADSVQTGWNGGLKKKSVFGGLATTFSGKSSSKPGTPLQTLPPPSPSIPSTPMSKPASSFKPRTPNALNSTPAFQSPHLAPELSTVPGVGSEDDPDSAYLAIRRGSHVSFLESRSQRPSTTNSATSFPAPAFASASPSSSSPSQSVFSPNFSLSVPSALAASTISSYSPPRSTTSPSFPPSVQIDLARSSPPPPTSAPALSSVSGRRTSSTERLQPGSNRHRPSTPINSINQPSFLRESSAVDDSLDASTSQRVSLPPFSQLEDASNSTADSQTPSSPSTRRSSAGTTESSALSPSTPSGGALPPLTASESTSRVKLSTISQKGEPILGTDEEQARKPEEEDSDDGVDDDDDEEVGGEPDEREELALRRVLELTEPGPNGEPNWGRSRRSKGSRGMSSSGRMIGSTSAEAGGGGGGDDGSGSWTGSGSDGTNKESMARFMNRKASLLMLSFPLAYVVLFSVSLIRIIYDFVRPKPIPALSAVARWMIFAQGLLDAIIYGIIEWNVKRTVRRKVRRGYSSPAVSRWDTAAVSGGVFDESFAGSGGAGGGGVSGGSTSFTQRTSVGRTTGLGVVS